MPSTSANVRATGQVAEAARGTWMGAGLKGKDLLYVSALERAIYVFTYPQGKLVGKILGNMEPDGLCSDAKGDVFMADYERPDVLEFAHGGTQPIATLSMGSVEFPESCAVDPKTGNLAVTTDNGAIGVFKGAKGSPTFYGYTGVYNTWYCTYDGSGNLFAGGTGYDYTFALVELPSGSSNLKLIDVPGTVITRLGLQWDGKYLTLESQQDFNRFELLRLTVSGSSATIVGKTFFKGAADEFAPQYWLGKGVLVQADGQNENAGFWKYPAGGAATQTLQDVDDELVGVTVSFGRTKR